MDRPSVGPDGKRAFKLERQVSVISAIARVSLGVMYTVNFIKGVHREEGVFWDDDKGDFRVPCQMMWYLRKVRKCNNDTRCCEPVVVNRLIRATTLPR